MAGGFTIEESKIEIFRNFSKRRFSKVKPDLSKNKKLILDSEILGTAINIDFYEAEEKPKSKKSNLNLKKYRKKYNI